MDNNSDGHSTAKCSRFSFFLSRMAPLASFIALIRSIDVLTCVGDGNRSSTSKLTEFRFVTLEKLALRFQQLVSKRVPPSERQRWSRSVLPSASLFTLFTSHSRSRCEKEVQVRES